MISTRRTIAWLVVALIVAWLLSMTLRPGERQQVTSLIPFQYKFPAVLCLLQRCREAEGQAAFLLWDVLGNLAVFVPFGAALAIATLPTRAGGRPTCTFGKRWWLRIAGTGFLLSLSIELAQLLIPTRATDVDDVILNTLGTAIGALLVVLCACLGTRDRGQKLGARR
jgi:glycopeptide antibiotics resistance protein